MKIKNYVRPENLEEAYELNQKRSARVIGGMLWMRAGRETIPTGVDLSGLGLNEIVETEEEFRIGAMVTLRQLELHSGLNAYTMGAMKEAVRSIVGVQFRNLATVGGSIWGRFGFSDVLTLFLALDTDVELYKGGVTALEKFAGMKKDNDILTGLIVRKRPQSTVYRAFRNARTDFPILTCAVSIPEVDAKCGAGVQCDVRTKCGAGMQCDAGTDAKCETGMQCDAGTKCGAGMQCGADATCGVGIAVVGARPGRAMCLEIPREFCLALCRNRAAGEMIDETAAKLAEQIPMGTNMRGSAEYRSSLAKVLLKRNFEELSGRVENNSLEQEGGTQN